MGVPILALLASAPQILNAGQGLVEGLSDLFDEDVETIDEALAVDPGESPAVMLACQHNVLAAVIEAFQQSPDCDEQENVLNDYITLNLTGALKGIESRLELIKMKAALEEAGVAPNGLTPDGQVAASEPIAFSHEDGCVCDHCTKDK